jgi:hypothetical protein
MIDLTNKSVDEINELIQKYAPLLELTKNKKEIPYLAYVLDVAIKYIETNHKEKHKDQRAWAATIVRWQYLDGKIKNESDIAETIDEFFQYIKDELQTYVSNMVAASQYDLEAGFVHQFIQKKNGSQ